MAGTDPARVTDHAAPRFLFRASVWLGVSLVAVKAYYLGAPAKLTAGESWTHMRSLAAISYGDAVFASVIWLGGRVALALAGERQPVSRAVCVAVVMVAGLSCAYSVASVLIFGVLGGFLTYSLIAAIGEVRMVSSSVGAHVTATAVLALIGFPIVYVMLVLAPVGLPARGVGPSRRRDAIAVASLGLWVILGQHAFSATWATRQERRIAENPHWVLISSWARAVLQGRTVRLVDRFPATDLADFEPLGRAAAATVLNRVPRSFPLKPSQPATARPPNVILVVLESVAARWTSLGGGAYDTTPSLKTASSLGLTFDNFYAHTGRSSSSLVALLLSAYPMIDFRDITQENPRLPGTSLSGMFRDRGYRTAFLTSSDLNWAGWDAFLKGRGFEEIRDYQHLSCSPPLSSWGVEDRCMIDAMLDFLERNRSRPFFLMGWTQQTHHPYEPTPHVPLLDLVREPVPDTWSLGRYLNVLRETDGHLGRLFEAIHRAGLAQDTLVVIVGDHGQAFGYPHDTWIQGRTVYEEDIHVPLMFWFPRIYKVAKRSAMVGGHVDLAPTIAHLAGLPAAADWQGRDLLESVRSQRAYFYVAEEDFTLGVREQQWKYLLNLRTGAEELYNLDRDPAEQHNLAAVEPARAARLRQRLAAWTEANRKQYERSFSS